MNVQSQIPDMPEMITSLWGGGPTQTQNKNVPVRRQQRQTGGGQKFIPHLLCSSNTCKVLVSFTQAIPRVIFGRMCVCRHILLLLFPPRLSLVSTSGTNIRLSCEELQGDKHWASRGLGVVSRICHHVARDYLYIDFGHKFGCVYTKPRLVQFLKEVNLTSISFQEQEEALHQGHRVEAEER